MRPAESSAPAPRRGRRLAEALQLYALLGGAISFAGWALDLPRLTDWSGMGISIQPNAAIAAMLASTGGLFLLRGRPRWATVLGACLVALAGATLVEHAFGIDLGIDRLLLFGRTWGETRVVAPGRMGPQGALSWALIGGAIVLAARPLGERVRSVAPMLGLIPVCAATLSLVGYLYGASTLYALPTLTAIALQTATFVLATALGVVISAPDRAPMRQIVDHGAGGELVRRMLPVLIVLPITVGYLRLVGEQVGLYDLPFGTALRTVAEILLLSTFALWTAAIVSRQAARREEAHLALRASQDRLSASLESRERAEAAVQQKERHLQHITDSAAVLVAQCSRDLRYVFVNKTCAAFLGRSVDQIVGQRIVDVVGQEGFAVVRPYIERALAGERVEYETEFTFPGAGPRWMRIAYVPDVDQTGQVVGWIASSTDITVRHHAEAALRTSEARLEAELEDSKLLQRLSAEMIRDDVRALYDSLLDAAMTLMHSQFASMQVLVPVAGGTGELELISHKGFSARAAQHWSRVRVGHRGVCAKALARGERVLVRDVLDAEAGIAPLDLELYRELGIRSVLSTPLRSRGGDLVGMVSTHWAEPHEPRERDLRLLDLLARQAADLVERRRAESALRDSEVALSDAQRVAHVGSWEWNTLTGTFVASAELRRIHAVPADGAFPSFAAQDGFLYPHAEWVRLEAANQAALRSGLGYELDVQALRAGEPIWVTARCEPIRDDGGHLVGLRGTVQDVTERIRAQLERESLLERERLARQDAERAGKIKDEFLATLSHELRTPLHAVIGWSQILKRDLSDPEKVRTAVEIIERNGRLQAQLITDLLDISRILSGNMSLDLQLVELSTVVRAAVESITPAAQAKGLELELDVEPLAQMVQGDAARLQQVVWNLLTNAVKFTPRGGTVRVSLSAADRQAEIRVSDTGRGIDADFLPHVFERFRQADASASRSYGGLGLGLAIVKQFVELHGGEVRASSEGMDRGATFTVRLPLEASAIEQGILRPLQLSARRPAPPRALHGLRVLLVDDEPDALAMVRQFLGDCGAAVGAVPSVQAALDLLGQQRFDVVVSDVAMPDRDGYELLRELRARDIPTPAIALTAFARPEDRERLLAAGFQGHVAKPVEPADLVEAVARLGGVPPIAVPEGV